MKVRADFGKTRYTSSSTATTEIFALNFAEIPRT